jgi:hypothetical protein
VIIGILYRIFLHQTPSKRIPEALRKYSIYYIKCLLHLRLEWRTNRWTPCLLSVESKEAPIIGNTWVSRENFLGISSRAVDLLLLFSLYTDGGNLYLQLNLVQFWQFLVLYPLPTALCNIIYSYTYLESDLINTVTWYLSIRWVNR